MTTSRTFNLLISTLLVAVIMGFASLKYDTIGKINFILGDPGDVRVIRAGKSSLESAKLYSAVYNGDQVKTEKESRCEIKLSDQSVIRIGEQTAFTFQENKLTHKFNSELKNGRIWANIKSLNPRNQFQLRTPTAVCSIRGTIYRIDSDSSTKVLVYQGAVDVGPLWAVKNDTLRPGESKILQQPFEVPGPTQIPGPFEVSLDQWVRIVAGQQIEVRADGKYYQSKINNPIDQQDDWVKWNRQRDGVE